MPQPNIAARIGHRIAVLALAGWLGSVSLVAAQAAADNAPTADAPAPEVQAQYRTVVTTAIAEFDAGRFAEARALFLRAHELWPSARTFRTLGMTAFELRLYPTALVELQTALDDPRRPLEESERTQLHALLDQTRAFVGHYRVHPTPAEVELSVDGAPLVRDASAELVLAVGEHSVLARAPGYQELRRTLVVQGGEDKDLAMSLQPLAPETAAAPAPAPPVIAAEPRPPQQDLASAAPGATTNRTPAIIAFAVAGAGVVAGSISGLIAFGEKPSGSQPVSDRDLEAGHRAADISTVSFIAAGAAAVVGAVLWLTAGSRAAPDETSKRSRAYATRVVLGPLGIEGRW